MSGRRQRHGRARAIVLVLAVSGAVLVGVAPASAFADPAVLSATPATPEAEDLGGVTFSGECPVGTDHAELRWDPGAAPVTAPVTLDANGVFTGEGPYFTRASPGLGLAVTLDCLQGATSLGAAYEFVSYPDLGATISAPASVPLDAVFAPTFDCGTPVAPSAFSSARVSLYDPADVLLDQVSGLPVPAGTVAALGTPHSYGLGVGDTVSIYVDCFVTTGGSPFVAGYRFTSLTIGAAALPPTVGGGGIARELAESGTSPEAAARTGLTLVVAGVALWFVHRRRRGRVAR